MVFTTTWTQHSTTDDVRVDGCGSRARRGWRGEGGSARGERRHEERHLYFTGGVGGA
jgi:hypothetical protein